MSDVAPAAAPVQAAPAPAQEPSLMDANFGRPSLDQIAANLDAQPSDPKQDFGQTGNQPEPAPENPEHEPAPESKNSVDDFMDRERKMFADRQALKVEREQFEADKQKPRDYLNSSDEDLDAMIDKIISGGEGDSGDEEPKQLTQQEMRDQIKAELMDDLKAQDAVKEEENFITDYKASIVTEIEGKEDFALTSSFGQSDMVYEVIESDYKQKAELYGDAYAKDNMLTIADSAKLVEKHLASQMQTALQSDKNGHLRNALLGFLGNNQDQSSQDQLSQTTITPEITQTSNTPIDKTALTEEQRFAMALAKM